MLEVRCDDFKVKRIRGGTYDGLYEITYKGTRIEAGGPFVTRKTATRLMHCEIAERRNNFSRWKQKGDAK